MRAVLGQKDWGPIFYQYIPSKLVNKIFNYMTETTQKSSRVILQDHLGSAQSNTNSLLDWQWSNLIA